MVKNESEKEELCLPTRSRILQLLQKAVQHSVVMLTAGSGFGKTKDLKTFIDNSKYCRIWVSASQLDQDIDRFWDSFCCAVKQTMPELGAEMSRLDFPDTSTKFNTFIKLFTKYVYSGDRVILIVDNYDLIDQLLIDDFFRRIIDFEIENLCVLLVTRGKDNIGISALKRKELFVIGREDMAYRSGEIKSFFESQNLMYSAKRLREIEEMTDGWPLAIKTFASRRTLAEGGEAERLALLDELFDKYFTHYPADIQKLFVQLSFLDTFTVDIIRMMGSYEPLVLFNIIRTNMFINYDKQLKQYTFFRLYREFLRRKDTVTDENTRRVLRLQARKMYLKKGRIVDAVTCFKQCGEVGRVLNIIADFHLTNVNIDKHHADFFIQTIEEIDEASVPDPTPLNF